MIRLVQTETHELTPKLATDFVAMRPMPGERLRNPRRLKTITGWLVTGHFSGAQWATVTCLENGLTYRADGQHSSYLLCNLPSEVSFPDGQRVSISKYQVDTISELAAAFDLFNSPASVRNTEDKLGLFLANYPGEMGDFQDNSPGRRFVLHILNGIDLFEVHPPAGKRRRSVPVRERGVYLAKQQYRMFLRWAATFRDTKGAKFLGRPGVVQEMLGDWITLEAPATTFWTHVFRADHQNPSDPSRELYEQLSRMLERSKRYKQSDYKREANRAWRRFNKSTPDSQSAQADLSLGDFTPIPTAEAVAG